MRFSSTHTSIKNELSSFLCVEWNHLGNVLTTISDKKIPRDEDQNGTIDYFSPDIQTTSDYYPFGASMKQRSFHLITASTGAPLYVDGTYTGTNFDKNIYRAGFNSMEKENDLSGDNYDFGARILDSRLGKWMSMDLMQSQFPGSSPYSFVLNSPLIFVDPDGNKVRGVSYDAETNTFTYNKHASKDAIKILTAMSKTPTGFNDAKKLIESSTKIKIKLTDRQLKEGFADTRTSDATDDNGTPKRAKITISTFDIKEGEFKGEGSFNGVSEEEYLNAVGVHESVHATNPNQIILDNKLDEMGYTDEFNEKSKAQQDEIRNKNIEQFTFIDELQTREEYNLKTKGTGLPAETKEIYKNKTGKSADTQKAIKANDNFKAPTFVESKK